MEALVHIAGSGVEFAVRADVHVAVAVAVALKILGQAGLNGAIGVRAVLQRGSICPERLDLPDKAVRVKDLGVFALPVGVAVGQQVGGVLVQLVARCQHHQGHARAGAFESCAQGSHAVDDVTVRRRLDIQPALQVGSAVQLRQCRAFDHTDHGIHRGGACSSEGQRRAGRDIPVVAVRRQVHRVRFDNGVLQDLRPGDVLQGINGQRAGQRQFPGACRTDGIGLDGFVSVRFDVRCLRGIDRSALEDGVGPAAIHGHCAYRRGCRRFGTGHDAGRVDHAGGIIGLEGKAAGLGGNIAAGNGVDLAAQ